MVMRLWQVGYFYHFLYFKFFIFQIEECNKAKYYQKYYLDYGRIIKFTY